MSQPSPLSYAAPRPPASVAARALARWDAFWFAPADPRALGFSRLVVVLGALAYYGRVDFQSWGYVRDSFWVPVFPFKNLHLHPLGPTAMWALGLVWKASLLLGGIGLFTRTSCGVAFVLGLYLLGLPNNLGKIDHADGLALWALGVLAVARSGDSWSIDAVVAAALGKLNPRAMVGPPPGPAGVVRRADHAEYRWPVRAMQVLMALIFFASGTAKLHRSGFRAWVFSDNLRNTMLMQQYLHSPWVDWGVWIADHRLVCWALAAGAITAETLAPLALFSRPVRRVLIPSLLLMQVGNQAILGIDFRQFMLVYAFWVNWPWVGWVARRMVAQSRWLPRRHTILFDGSCGICTRTMAVFRRLDLLRRTEVMDVINDWPAVAARYPAMSQTECLRSMYSVDDRGQATDGFDAYRQLAYAIPLAWPIVPLLYVPGVPLVGRRVYRYVAEHRFDAGCGIDRPVSLSEPGRVGPGPA